MYVGGCEVWGSGFGRWARPILTILYVYIYYYIYNLNDEEMDVETWGLSGSNPLVFQVFTLKQVHQVVFFFR